MSDATRFPHLPPGYLPGRQTRRGRIGHKINVFFLVLFGVGLGAGGAATYGYAMVCSHEADLCQPGWLFLAAGGGVLVGVPLLVLARHLVRGRGGWRRATHLSVFTPVVATTRGAAVPVTMSGHATRPDGSLEVGLVCRVAYDVEIETTNAQGHTQRSRMTRHHVIHEEWRPVTTPAADVEQQFVIPLHAPFSHEGACLSFAWWVEARERRERGTDPSARQPIWVAR